jgi:hypothetical protein
MRCLYTNSKRDGRNLGMDDFDNALLKVVNFSPHFIRDIFTAPQFRLLGILAQDHDHTDETINLEDLNFHGHNEHDASMSRLDKIQGDTIKVQPALVEKMPWDTVPVDYPYLNTSSIGRTRARKEKESRAAGSGQLDKDITIKPGVAEGALALIFIREGGYGDANKLFARKERLREWMNYERMPKGWKRSKRVLVTGDFIPLLNSVQSWRDHWSKS